MMRCSLRGPQDSPQIPRSHSFSLHPGDLSRVSQAGGPAWALELVRVPFTVAQDAQQPVTIFTRQPAVPRQPAARLAGGPMYRTRPKRTARMPSADGALMMTLAYLLGISTCPVWHQAAACWSAVRRLSCRRRFTKSKAIAVSVPATVCARLRRAWNWLLHAVIARCCCFTMRTPNSSVVAGPVRNVALLLVLVVCFT